jgi:hypothetical protein
MRIDVKVIITIVTLLVPLVGFYYTTNMRLDVLEADIAAIKSDVKQVKRKTNKRKKNR